MTTTQAKDIDALPTAPEGATEGARESKGRKSASAFRTISEVADELGVQQHVLRFWETKFSHVKPLKRGGGRRYYRPEDVALLKKIHELLYTEGYTIKGVQKLLREQGKAQLLGDAPASVPANRAAGAVAQTVVVPAASARPAAAPAVDDGGVVAAPATAAAAAPSNAGETAAEGRPGLTDRQRAILNSMLGELKDLRDLIKNAG